MSQCSRYVVCMDRIDHSHIHGQYIFQQSIGCNIEIGQALHSTTFNLIHPTIRVDSRLYPYFENCISAIDSIYVSAHILGNEQT